MDLLYECREIFDEVRLEMIKPPENLDFSRSGIDRATITERTVLHDGPVREVCQRFPRNVNTLAAAAFAGKGLDETRAVLIADPDETKARVNIYAQGGGVEMKAMRGRGHRGCDGRRYSCFRTELDPTCRLGSSRFASVLNGAYAKTDSRRSNERREEFCAAWRLWPVVDFKPQNIE